VGCDKCDEFRSKGGNYCGACGASLSMAAEQKRTGCDKCDEFRSKGSSYCGACGTHLNVHAEPQISGCGRCDEFRSKGESYCGACGRFLGAGTMPRIVIVKSEPGKAVFYAGLCIMAICSIILIFEMITAFRFSLDVFDGITEYTTSIFIVTPWMLDIVWISDGVLQAYYIFLLAAMTVSVGYILFKTVGPLKRFFKDKNTEPMKNTALFEMTVLFAATYAIQMAFILIITIAGVDVESPTDGLDIIALLFLLLQASVWEEVITRILFIGVPMLIVSLILTEKGTKWWRYLAGGFGMSRRAIVLIFFSAAIFGLAHVPGWDLWKLFPTFLVGLVLGYLFVKYGVYASIAMHFLTDYLSSSDWMFGDGGVSITILLIAVMLLGIPYIWIYAKRGLRYIQDCISR